jgi:hypothetical protein
MNKHFVPLFALLCYSCGLGPSREPQLNGSQAVRKAPDTLIGGFELVLEGTGSAADGSRFSFSRYRASDGIIVQRRVERYGPKSEMKKRAALLLSKADRVIATSATNPQDRVVVPRTVVFYHGVRGEQARAVVFWSQDNNFYLLESPSIRHVLSFESKPMS